VLPHLVRTHSVDSGFTWGMVQDTGLAGDFPSLILLPDGRLLLTHTQRRANGSAVLAHVSDDGGVTWRQVAFLREADDQAFYYPNTVVLPDKTLLTAVMTAGPDRIRFVEAVRWKVD